LLPLVLPWAVHIADGVLDWPVLAAGFAVSAALALLASWRVRDEEVPRIALLTAAFFVASSIHVKVGPTSVHLLLNGLVGVILGWRAPLAILVGVTLQALLIPHGGLTTIGVNAAVEALPALAAGALFPALRSWLNTGRPWRRSALVGLSAFLWGGLLVFAVAALAAGPPGGAVSVSGGAGVIVSPGEYEPALRLLLHPATLALLAAFAVASAWLERRMEHAPEFPAGAFVGAFAVVGTTALTGLVLVADGADRWATFAEAVFLIHLPLALIEGFILGVTVAFLARVKPELLGEVQNAECRAQNEEIGERVSLSTGGERVMTMMVLALAGVALTGQPARAHRLEAEPKVDVKKKQVTIESWYETGDPPKEAAAKVVREDGSVLAEGPIDAKGRFTFTYDKPESLRVQISAPGGHRATVRLTAKELGAAEEAPEPRREAGTRGQDVLLGLTFLLALAAFVLSWRNGRRLAALTRSPEARG
jgi:cobalt/nickel transport system permease protein